MPIASAMTVRVMSTSFVSLNIHLVCYIMASVLGVGEITNTFMVLR